MLLSTAAEALENDQRWYLSGMMAGIDADKDRGADDDIGGLQLGFGKHMGKWWSVELVAVGARFEDGSQQLARQWGFGLDFLRYVWPSEQYQPYLVAGAGWLMTDRKLGRQDDDGGMAALGFGLKMPGPLGMEFRTDFRARRDYGGPGQVTDLVWNFGFNVPLSGRRADIRRIGDPAAAGDQPPAYRYVSDSDGDGLLDPEDRCPNSAGGAAVNEFGCAPSDDADGDNVPDSEDICGDTPAGQSVDKYGCRITPPATLSVPTDSR